MLISAILFDALLNNSLGLFIYVCNVEACRILLNRVESKVLESLPA